MGQRHPACKLVWIPLCTLQELTSLPTESGQPLAPLSGEAAATVRNTQTHGQAAVRTTVSLVYIRAYLPPSYWLLNKRNGVLLLSVIG